MTDWRGSINGPLHPLTIRAQSNRLLLLRKSWGASYYIRPLSLDWFIEREVFSSRIYGTQCPPAFKVVDVGAHIGLASLALGGSGARVIALEPDPVNFPMLLLNTAMNPDLNVEAYRMAVASMKGKVFLKTERNTGNSSLLPYSFSSGKWVPVDAVRLDMFLPADVVKVDAEGAEYEILTPENIEKIKSALYVEYHKHVPDWKARLRHLTDSLDFNGFEYTVESHGYNGYLKARRK